MNMIPHSLFTPLPLGRQKNRGSLAAIVPITVVCLTGCAVEPLTRAPAPIEPPLQSVAQVYAYPTQGQSGAQLDRDRYECHQWAFQQSHFDPSVSPGNYAPAVVESTPARGTNTAAGAIVGAVLGAAIGSPHDTAAGAIAGSIAGAAIGAASEGSGERSGVQQHYAQHDERELALAQDYRRALSACLEGRGYTVK